MIELWEEPGIFGLMFWLRLPSWGRLHNADDDEPARGQRVLVYKSGDGFQIRWRVKERTNLH